MRTAMNKVSRYVRGLKMPTKLSAVYTTSRVPSIDDTVEKLYCSHRGRAETSSYPLMRSYYEVYRGHVDVLPDHITMANKLGIDW